MIICSPDKEYEETLHWPCRLPRIVKECVKTWFGSESSFEDKVRTEVLEILNRDLTEKVFSTPWALAVSSPLMLAFMDVSASWTSVNHLWEAELWSHPAIALLLEGLVLWLLFVPPTKDVLILLLRLGRRRPRSTCLELLKNALVLGAAAVPILLVILAYAITRFADLIVFGTENATLRAVAFACCTLLISCVQLPLTTCPESTATAAWMVMPMLSSAKPQSLRRASFSSMRPR